MRKSKDRAEDMQVKKWLLEQGYPLEMATGREFEKAGFWVSQGEYYKDPETNKPREVDIIAGITETPSSKSFRIKLLFVVECKSSKKDKPWVLFSRGKAPYWPLSALPSSDNKATNLLSNLSRVDGIPETGFLRGPKRTAYGGTLAFKESNQDPVYNSFLSISQAMRHVEKVELLPPVIAKADKIELRAGLIVVKGSVFDAHLSDNGELEVQKIGFGRLRWKREGLGEGVNIDVVSMDHLRAYLKSARTELNTVVQACDANPDLINKKMWIEEALKRHQELKHEEDEI